MEKELNEEKNKKNPKKIVLIIIAIILILAIIICILFIPKDSSGRTIAQKIYSFFAGESNTVGNTIGNIRNYGYAVTDNDYLYFMCPNDEGTAIGIRRIAKDDLTGTSEMLIEGDWQIVGLNYMDGYIYFITMANPEDEDSEDIVDNKIYRMKTDGSEATIINDNDFNNDCYEIYVVRDKIYYIGIDECIYYMDLDGNNRTKLNDNASGFIGITEDYIFFNKIIEDEVEETDDSSVINYETYMMDLDGSNEHPVMEGEKLYNINVVGDYIYYQTNYGYPSRVKLDGTENTMLSDEVAYSMIATEEGIFYLNYYKEDGVNAGVAIYRMDLDGSNITELTKLDSYSTMLCEFGDWLYYSDNDDYEGRFELISKDGKQSIVLYNLDLSIYDTDSETDKNDNTVSQEDTETVNEVTE